jgi:hypothetical protein
MDTSHFKVINILLSNLCQISIFMQLITLGTLSILPKNWLEDGTLMLKHVTNSIVGH